MGLYDGMVVFGDIWEYLVVYECLWGHKVFMRALIVRIDSLSPFIRHTGRHLLFLH